MMLRRFTFNSVTSDMKIKRIEKADVDLYVHSPMPVPKSLLRKGWNVLMHVINASRYTDLGSHLEFVGQERLLHIFVKLPDDAKFRST